MLKVLCINDLTDYISHGLLDTMSQMGHQVKIFPLRKVAWEKQEKTLLTLIREKKPHFVFTPGWSVGIFNTEAFFRVLRKTRVPHIYWATEDPLFFEEVSMVFVPHSDYVFTTAVELENKYRELGLPASTLMFGVNPSFHYPSTPKPKYAHDIILIANNYPWFTPDKQFRNHAIRTVLIPLIQRGYDVKVFGVDWTNPENEIHIPPEYYGGYCPYEETRIAYSSAKIVLGLQSVDSSVTQTSCRTFEILGSGAFYLTIYTPSHEAHFENHHHLTWTKHPEETLEIVDYYLRHDEARKKVAENGRSEVLQKHTY